MDIGALAERIADGLPTASGRVLVRDRSGVAPLVDAVAAELSARGLEPVVERVDDETLRAMLAGGSLDDVAAFEAARAADARVVVSTSLHTSEAALTGESLPVSKDADPVASDATIGTGRTRRRRPNH